MEIHDIDYDFIGIGDLSVEFGEALDKPSVKRADLLARRTQLSTGTEARFGG